MPSHSKRAINDLPGAFLRNVSTKTKYLIKPSLDFAIGRAMYCSIIVTSPFISRKHCVIKFVDDEYRVYDNGSSGTYLNWNKLSYGDGIFGILNDGDHLSIGASPLQHVYQFYINRCCVIKRRKDFEHELRVSIRGLTNEVKVLKSEKNILSDTVKVLMNEYSNMLKEAEKSPNLIQPILGSLSKNFQELKEKIQISSELYDVEGFKNKVYRVLEEHWKCTICQGVITWATATNCSHFFCYHCVNHLIDAHNNVLNEDFENNGLRCPVCRTQFKSLAKFSRFENLVRNILEAIDKPVDDEHANNPPSDF